MFVKPMAKQLSRIPHLIYKLFLKGKGSWSVGPRSFPLSPPSLKGLIILKPETISCFYWPCTFSPVRLFLLQGSLTLLESTETNGNTVVYKEIWRTAFNFTASRRRYSILVPGVSSINPKREEGNIHGGLKFLFAVSFKLSIFKSDDIIVSNRKLFSFSLLRLFISINRYRTCN